MKGRQFGAILLITGCCIGAGMLGLPVVSALAGFIPSTLAFVLIWLFMMITGLLVLEVNLWFHDDVSFISMAERTLGTAGKFLSGFLFLFLFYNLMVAYISGGGELCNDFAKEIAGVDVPGWVSSLFITVLLGIVIYISTAAVDLINRLFMAGLALTYLLLIGVGVPHINTDFLRHNDWSYVYVSIPVMVISFGFHNLIPSMVGYLDRNKNKIRTVIVVGSAIPLLIYLFWDGLIMGLVPVEYLRDSVDNGNMATRALKNVADQPWVGEIAEYFAFFALVTSFLGVALSLVDFLADGLQVSKKPSHRLLVTLLALGPPLFFALLYPNLFLWALGIAGGFSAVILFGILPALMVWKGRYQERVESKPLVAGGKPVLVIVILIACGIVVSQLIQELGHLGVFS